MENAPHDNGSKGLSSLIAILTTRRNRESGGVGIPRVANDSVMALWSRVCRVGYDTCVGVRGPISTVDVADQLAAARRYAPTSRTTANNARCG